ncbi:hypothetical protein RJT34_11189 [Clitoria ternatea]|uniref:Uncharacterized protein n=1 Tax=Clitoria ternatea TaxID=43366 RepID=A0AAN9JLL4_CLITE
MRKAFTGFSYSSSSCACDCSVTFRRRKDKNQLPETSHGRPRASRWLGPSRVHLYVCGPLADKVEDGAGLRCVRYDSAHGGNEFEVDNVRHLGDDLWGMWLLNVELVGIMGRAALW